jgi:outer membrane cobalamin receptor
LSKLSPGGVNLAYDNDPIVTTNNFRVYPVLGAEYQLAEALRVYAGLSGELQRTSLNDFSWQNPFLNNQNLTFLHTNQTLEFKGGLRGKLNQNFTYDVSAALGNYKNLSFLVNSLQDSAKFQLLYEPETSQIFRVGGELTYSQTDQFQIRLQSNYYGYNLETIADPWHRPNFTTNLIATAQPIEKLKLNLDFQVLGGLRGYNFISNRQVNLATIADLSLKVDYLVLDNFSAFVAVNNILGTQYQRFLYYPNQSINFLIGLTYGFGR